MHTGSGFYRTTDGGNTFTQLGFLMMAQGAFDPFADPDRRTLLTGTHGVGISKSIDSGRTFIDVTLGVPGNTLWPLLLDSRTFLMGTFDQGSVKGAVYRTIDGGASWTQMTTLSPSHDATFLRASDDSLYLSLEGNAGIMRIRSRKDLDQARRHGSDFRQPGVRHHAHRASRRNTGHDWSRSSPSLVGSRRELEPPW